MQYDSWHRARIKVSDIDLDPENIRLDVDQKTQEALLADLFVNEDAMQVLESIVSNGIFPDELPIVVEEKERYVVLEGNRRLAALKAINNPASITPFTSKISILATTFPKVEDIEVLIAPGREETQQHLGNRHTINTRRQWKPLRQAQFYKAQLESGKTIDDLRHDYPGIDIPKFVRMWEMHQLMSSVTLGDPDLDRKVRNQRSFPITTLERLYDDPAFRLAMGLEFDSDGHVRVSSNRAEFEAALKKIALDIIDRTSPDHIDSRQLNNSSNIGAYIQKLRPPKKVAGNRQLAADDFEAVPAAPVPSPAPSPTTVQTRRHTKLAPQDIVNTLTSVGVGKMLTELQNIDYHSYPIAAHDLLRSFLECTLKAYFQAKNHTVNPGRQGGQVQLNALLGDFANAEYGFGDSSSRQLALRIQSSDQWTSYSANFLNATNHNPDIFPTPTEVEEAWDGMQALLRVILNP